MTTPTNTSGLLQADGASVSSTFNAGFTFTAGRAAVVTLVHFNSNEDRISAVLLGGSIADLVARASIGDATAEIWQALSVTGGTSDVVVTYGGGSDNYVSGGVTEWAAGTFIGLDSGTENTATGNSATPAVSTAISTSQAATIIIGCMGPFTSSSDNGITGPTGYTTIFTEQDSANHEAGRGSWKEESSAGVKTATWGMNSGNWMAAIAAYKLAAAGGGGIVKQMLLNH